MIWENIDNLASHLQTSGKCENIVMTSGGFDPIHVGHVRCIIESANISEKLNNSTFVVVANADEFLLNKKGFVFMPEGERMEILQAIKGVDHVVRWYDGTQTCTGAIERINPTFFTKGGDRSSRDRIPEADICDTIGCKILYGIGGKEKAQSSSWLTSEHNKNEGEV